MSGWTKGREIKKGILAGLWSGILASLCCIGPLVIILLGLGSISLALGIGQYKPYFIGFGIFFLFLAIFFHFQRNKCNIFSFRDLKREKHFIISAVLSMGIIYSVALYAVVPAIGPAIYENVRSPNQVAAASNLHKLTLKIDGMTCPDCVDIIENGLLGMDGVAQVKISYSEGAGEVIYDPGKITKEQIVDSEVFTPFTVEIVSGEPVK